MPDYGIGLLTNVSSRGEAGHPITALHVVTVNQRRGAEIFAVDLTDALARHDVGGHAVALAPGPDGHALGVASLGSRPFAAATLRALRRQSRSVDVVVAHGSKTLPACVAALVGTRVPFVYRSIGDPMAWSSHGLRRWRTAALLRRATAVVALWPDAARAFTSLHGVRPEKLQVIPNGVPASRCPVPNAEQRAVARRTLGLPAEASVASYVGALSPEKGVAVAIAAVGKLDGMHLLVVGEGADRAQLAYVAETVAPGRVHFGGSHTGPQQAFAAADLVVLPSRTEGMPGVLIEGALSGRPAVASDVGGVGQIVRHGITGMLAQPGDPASFADGIQAVLTDAAALGHAARRHCLMHFEIGPVATRWAQLLSDVAHVPRQSRW